jgi:uncharacterized protein YdcH (DUF465 family)
MEEATNQKSFSMVFKELEKTINVIGVEKLLIVLKNSRTLQIDDEKIKQALEIIQLTCDEFQLTTQEFFGEKRSNNRRFAIGVSANLLGNKLGLNNVDISFILKKSDSLISVLRNEINRLDESHPTDNAIIKKMKNIKLKLKDN